MSSRGGGGGGWIWVITHMLSHHWLAWIPCPLCPSTLDFHPMASCHMSTHGPHLSSCLTNPAHDMWHLLSHSKCDTCPAPLGVSKNVKFRLSRNLAKFDVVARFHETIPMVKSVSSSEI